MPGYVKHLQFAFVVYAAIVALNYSQDFMPIETLLLTLPLYLIAALFPDLDHPNSKIRRWTEKLLLAATLLILAYGYDQHRDDLMQLAMVPVGFILILWLMKHRGIFHTEYAALLFPLPLLYISLPFYALAAIGYETHLVADRTWKNEET